MPTLTPEGLRTVTGLATQNGVSIDAALHLLDALARGGGRQAQFNHPDLGGMGQWSRGGMIMIGDMFNQGLKARVDRLCHELAALPPLEPFEQDASGKPPLFEPTGDRGEDWPADLGPASSTGAQNDQRYAYFPESRRLAIRRNGETRIYDAGVHEISGVSQQQSGDSSMSFTSQLGPVRIEDLRQISPDSEPAPSEPGAPSSAPPTLPADEGRSGPPGAGEAIVAVIERLAELRRQNILTEEEFAAKKRELLSRL